MRVVILHEAIAEDARQDELDVLDQALAVRTALAELGHGISTLQLDHDLGRLAAGLRAAAPDVVFNLVESVAGEGRLVHLAPQLLDRVGVPYTGSQAEATRRAASKLSTKRVLLDAGLPTPRWFTAEELGASCPVPPGRYVLKSVWEHGSLGLDDDSVITVDRPEALQQALERRLPELGGEGFAEAYVHGREFNLALLEGGEGVECLPPAEIRFQDYGPSEPRIVGYRAKWSQGSREDERTPRSFEFPTSDSQLLDCLRDLALAVWRVFDLGGYARVDFRVDRGEAPQIVDVNTNPCLSRGAGFVAGLERAGLTLVDGVERIIAAALARHRGMNRSCSG